MSLVEAAEAQEVIEGQCPLTSIPEESMRNPVENSDNILNQIKSSPSLKSMLGIYWNADTDEIVYDCGN